jgi:hypothetical protein
VHPSGRFHIGRGAWPRKKRLEGFRLVDSQQKMQSLSSVIDFPPWVLGDKVALARVPRQKANSREPPQNF